MTPSNKAKLLLIISESRSGSTILSKEMNNNLGGVMVPPEIRFDLIMRKSNEWLKSTDTNSVYKLLMSKRSLDHLNLDKDSLIEFIETAKSSGSMGSLVMSILYEWAERNSSNEEIKYVVVKKGVTHLKIWEKVLNHCPHTNLVFLVRDPRAVVNSKFNTTRVYHPFETLGWSGSALLALRWKWHVNKTGSVSKVVPCHTVRYEDLIRNKESVISGLAKFLNVKVINNGNDYVVPEQEKKIHKLVDKDKLFEGRISGWKKELPIIDQQTIEFFAKNEMKKLNYELIHNLDSLCKAKIILRSLFISLRNLFVHHTTHIFINLKSLIRIN